MTLPDPPPPSAAPSDPRWVRYVETTLRFHTPAVAIDLRQALDAAALAGLEQLGLGSSFAVWTAENPFGEEKDGASNRERRERLEGELAAREVPFRRVTAESADGRYREECVAAAVDLPAAREMASALGQMALFWFDGRRFLLVGALVEAEPVSLPIDDPTPS
jgi:hypothetical protein